MRLDAPASTGDTDRCVETLPRRIATLLSLRRRQEAVDCVDDALVVLRTIDRIALHQQDAAEVSAEIDPGDGAGAAGVGVPVGVAVDVALVKLEGQAVAVVCAGLRFVELAERFGLDELLAVVDASVQVQLHQNAKVVER